MSLVVDSHNQLVFREFPWKISLFALFLTVVVSARVVLGVMDHSLKGYQVAIGVIAALGFLVAFFVKAHKTTFDFSQATADVRWSRNAFFANESGIIPFADIQEILLETTTSHVTPMYRLAIKTATEIIPLSKQYSADLKKHEALANRLREFLHLSGEHWVDESVESLVAQNRITHAIRILRTKNGLSLAEAHSAVKQIKKNLQQSH